MEKRKLILGVGIFLVAASILIFSAIGNLILTLIKTQGEASPQVYEEEYFNEEEEEGVPYIESDYGESVCECK